MFLSRSIEHRINKIGRVFEGLSYYPSGSKLTCKDLLDKNKTVSIHQKILQALVTEVFKEKLEIFKKLFSLIQFVIFKPLTYCFKETIGFYVKASFASCP